MWCSRCKAYAKLLHVSTAAKLANVDRKTIYRYIGDKSVSAVKIAGKTYRVCCTCLIREQ